jgi:hypothetical protein
MVRIPHLRQAGKGLQSLAGIVEALICQTRTVEAHTHYPPRAQQLSLDICACAACQRPFFATAASFTACSRLHVLKRTRSPGLNWRRPQRCRLLNRGVLPPTLWEQLLGRIHSTIFTIPSPLSFEDLQPSCGQLSWPKPGHGARPLRIAVPPRCSCRITLQPCARLPTWRGWQVGGWVRWIGRGRASIEWA